MVIRIDQLYLGCIWCIPEPRCRSSSLSSSLGLICNIEWFNHDVYVYVCVNIYIYLCMYVNTNLIILYIYTCLKWMHCFQTLVIPSMVITRWSKLILPIAGEDLHQKHGQKMKRKSGDTTGSKRKPSLHLAMSWYHLEGGYLGSTHTHDRWNSTRRNSISSMRSLVCFGGLGWFMVFMGSKQGKHSNQQRIHWCNGDLHRRGVCESLRLHIAIRPLLKSTVFRGWSNGWNNILYMYTVYIYLYYTYSMYTQDSPR